MRANSRALAECHADYTGKRVAASKPGDYIDASAIAEG
jgi:hypothetical protein